MATTPNGWYRSEISPALYYDAGPYLGSDFLPPLPELMPEDAQQIDFYVIVLPPGGIDQAWLDDQNGLRQHDYAVSTRTWETANQYTADGTTELPAGAHFVIGWISKTAASSQQIPDPSRSPWELYPSTLASTEPPAGPIVPPQPDNPRATGDTPSPLSQVYYPFNTAAYTQIYRYWLVDLMSNTIIAEVPMSDVSYSRKIRRAGECSGTIPVIGITEDLDLYNATRPGKTALFITRFDDCVWGGIIWTRSYDKEGQLLTINAATFESYLYHRQIWSTLRYSNTTDQYTVVRDLFYRLRNDFQGLHDDSLGNRGNIYIEVPNSMSGKKQDAQRFMGSEMRSFGETLETFSDNLNGFEYFIDYVYDAYNDTFRKFLVLLDTPPSQSPLDTTWAGNRQGLEANLFEHPGNIISFSFEESAEEGATRLFAVGGTSDNASATTPKPVGKAVDMSLMDNDYYPILDFVNSSEWDDVRSVDRLNRYAKRELSRRKPPVPTLSITVNGSLDPVIGTYFPGDWCRIALSDDPFLRSRYAGTDEGTYGIVKRILGYTVSVPTAPELPETVTLDLLDEWDNTGAGGG